MRFSIFSKFSPTQFVVNFLFSWITLHLLTVILSVKIMLNVQFRIFFLPLLWSPVTLPLLEFVPIPSNHLHVSFPRHILISRSFIVFWSPRTSHGHQSSPFGFSTKRFYFGLVHRFCESRYLLGEGFSKNLHSIRHRGPSPFMQGLLFFALHSSLVP